MNLTAKNYRPWTQSETDYPKLGTVREQINFIARYGILAPSVHNTQPWIIKHVNDHSLHITPDWTRQLAFSDTTNRGIYLSLGSCVLNILVAADHFGWAVDYRIVPGEDSSTGVNLNFQPRSANNSSLLGSLFPGIRARRSYKIPFRDGEVPQRTTQVLSHIRYGSARISVSRDKGIIAKVAQLHFASTLEFTTNRDFSREVSSWMRLSGTAKTDGMPGFTFGLSTVPSLLAKVATRLSPSAVKVVAKKDLAILSHAPAIGAVFVNKETPEELICAGLAYQHGGTSLASEKIFLAPKAAAIEAGHGKDLAKILGADGQPQIYFGLGFGDTIVRHTPRRSFEDIVLSEAVT